VRQRSKGHTKLETRIRQRQGQRLYTKGNKREKESRQKQYDKTTLGRIKGRQGPMGQHINRANWRRQSKSNGKYETVGDALNPQLWCIKPIMEEESSTSFMGSRYNTRAWEQLVYSRKENRQRVIAARTHRARLQRLQKLFELRKCLKITAMAPPKQAEASQSARPTRVQTRSRGPLEEDKPQQPEIVDIDEIPSPETIPVNPTPILEEIQQPEVEAMKVDTPAAAQEPQSQEAETQKEVQPESTEAAPEVNGTT
jgi:hypothetical protein